MKPLRFGAHGAGRLDGDHFQATRGKPSRIATKSARLSRGEANLSVFPGGLEMAEAITINDQELAIICDLMGEWGAKWDGKLDDNKRQALDQVIARGFAEPSEKGSLYEISSPRGPSPDPYHPPRPRQKTSGRDRPHRNEIISLRSNGLAGGRTMLRTITGRIPPQPSAPSP
jgi:hypothetical protein